MQMSKLMPVITILLFLISANPSVSAQDKNKAEKPTTTTVDAWRTALPVGETPAGSTQTPEEKNEAKTPETAAEIEKIVLDLEKRMFEALKARDSAMLKSLLADDFLLAGITVPGTKTDKTRYIDWAVKNFELRAFTIEKTALRVSPATAVVTYNYKRQANVGGASADGDFVVTNVWVKRGNDWLVISHHISPLPNP
jgi:ketosteroid isomerase-like protein